MTNVGLHHADRFEKEMEAVMNDPVYEGRFSVDIVYLTERISSSQGKDPGRVYKIGKNKEKSL